MRKLLLVLCTGILLLGNSCFPVNGKRKTYRSVFYNLKGNWIITDISYNKYYSIKPFDETVDISCFKGSNWELITNNNEGSYTLSNPKCAKFTTYIKFNVSEEGIFSFKKVPSGKKAKSIKSGYFLQIQNYNTNSFELVQNIGGNIRPIVYHFQKIN